MLEPEPVKQFDAHDAQPNDVGGERLSSAGAIHSRRAPAIDLLTMKPADAIARADARASNEQSA